ncbi:thiamine pyrophosphate-dependent enzyme [Salipiger abyssi]|uniref:thiamine pyrophosphate-dependent enzyme n=1 Tax=Salipiger abyssi TaxID=1250539 RepID=UPI001A8D10F5|nr:thiamine pyrophosphate-dependent enzyme [Salipiger abyssi]MBN9885873.1 hypothetical protein [Salipiger abyssi]
MMNETLLNRHETICRAVAALDDRDAVIGGIGNTNFDLWASGPRPANFYMLGSMGLAFPIALGVALAQPERKVVALEGDGSLLMQLGCLSTIAICAPANLTMIVFDNAMYQITGGQKTATASGADLIGIARSSGLTESHWAEGAADFDRLYAAALARSGPSLIGVPTDAAKAVGTTDRDPAKIRITFSEAMTA